jgi:hypothetical protein
VPPSTLLTVLLTHPAACAVACCATALPHVLPPALLPWLQHSMVFFRKAGRIDGRVNLELPPTADQVINCKMTDEDATSYQITEVSEPKGSRGQGHPSPITQRS